MLLYIGVQRYRYDETAAIRASDLIFEPTHMKIFVEKSKTDQYRDGKWLFITNGVTNLCPTKIVRLYLEKCDITDLHSEKYLFRSIAKGKGYEKLRTKPQGLGKTFAIYHPNILQVVGVAPGAHPGSQPNASKRNCKEGQYNYPEEMVVNNLKNFPQHMI